MLLWHLSSGKRGAHRLADGQWCTARRLDV